MFFFILLRGPTEFTINFKPTQQDYFQKTVEILKKSSTTFVPVDFSGLFKDCGRCTNPAHYTKQCLKIKQKNNLPAAEQTAGKKLHSREGTLKKNNKKTVRQMRQTVLRGGPLNLCTREAKGEAVQTKGELDRHKTEKNWS